MELGTGPYFEPTEPTGPLIAEDPEDFAAGALISGAIVGIAAGFCLPGVIAGAAGYSALVGLKWTGKKLWKWLS